MTLEFVEIDRPLWSRFGAFMDQELARFVEEIEELEDEEEMEPLGFA